MKLQSAVKVWLLAAAAAVGPVWSTLEEENVQRKRTLKEQAIKTVERFLWIFSGNGSKEKEIETTRVLWDGENLIPMDKGGNENEPSRAKRELLTSAHNENNNVRVGRIGRGRKNRRSRNLKGDKDKMPKSGDNDKIPKAAKGALNVIRKKPKGSKAGAAEVLCFKGFRDDVISACEEYNAGCCVGSQACSWNDDNDSRKTTVCQGSCNGAASCQGIAPGSYISENSCRSDQSCDFLASSSTEKDPVYVGPGSCVGLSACGNVCSKSPSCKIKIGANSCVDPYEAFGVCFDMAGFSTKMTELYVGPNSCLGFFACDKLGGENPNLQRIYLEKDSCTDKESCAYLGQKSTGGEIDISGSTCVQYRSCSKLGFSTKEIGLESYTCQGERSCVRMGYAASQGIVSVGTKGCQGQESCFEVGSKTSQDVVVAADSCTKEYACFGVGRDVTSEIVLIGVQACNSNPNQCSGKVDSSCYTTSNIRRYGTSC